MFNKLNPFFLTVATLTILYVVLSAMGIGGLNGITGGLVYRLIIIAALLFSCVRAFAGAGQRGAVLAGALGLSAFAVFEIYSLAYIYLLNGSPADITVSNYTRNCAYLFFMAAVGYLAPPVFKAYKTIRAILNAVVSAVTILIFYAVIADHYPLLAYSVLTITLMCLLSAVLLFCQLCRGEQCSSVRLFAGAIIMFCLLDTAYRLLIMFGGTGYLRDVITAFKPAAYLLIGCALTRLKTPGSAEPPSLENE